MTGWFASPAMIDVVLAVVALEAVWLIAGRKMPAMEAVLCLLPGVFIMLAVRAALSGVEGWVIAALLAASFPVHLADLARRRVFATRRRSEPPVA